MGPSSPKAFLAVFALFLTSGLASAQTTYYWDTANGGWNTAANWSTNSVSGGTGAVPGASDIGFFNQSSVINNETITLDSNYSVGGLTFANTGSTVLTGDGMGTWTLTLGSSGVTINSAAGAVTLGNATNVMNVSLAASQTWTNNSSNTFTVLNGISATGTQTLTIDGSGNTLLSGIIGNGSGTLGLTKIGTGTLTLTKQNTYTGGTTVNGGTLNLNFSAASAPTTNIISASSALTLGAGTLRVTGNGTSANQQTFASTALNAGGSTVDASSLNNAAAFVDLGTITRSAGGTLRFSTPVAGNIKVGNANDASGILGPWAFWGGADYAKNDGSGNVVALNGTVNTVADPQTAWSGSTVNSSFSSTTTVALSGLRTANTVRFVGSGNETIGLGTNNLQANGLMNAVSGTTLTFTAGTGRISAASGSEVILAGPGNITLSNQVFNTGTTVTKFGAGALAINAAQDADNYYMSGGAVSLAKVANLFGTTGTKSVYLNNTAVSVSYGDSINSWGTANVYLNGATLTNADLTNDTAAHVWGGNLFVRGNSSINYTRGGGAGQTGAQTFNSLTLDTAGAMLTINGNAAHTDTATFTNGISATQDSTIALANAQLSTGSGLSISASKTLSVTGGNVAIPTSPTSALAGTLNLTYGTGTITAGQNVQYGTIKLGYAGIWAASGTDPQLTGVFGSGANQSTIILDGGKLQVTTPNSGLSTDVFGGNLKVTSAGGVINNPDLGGFNPQPGGRFNSLEFTGNGILRTYGNRVNSDAEGSRGTIVFFDNATTMTTAGTIWADKTSVVTLSGGVSGSGQLSALVYSGGTGSIVISGSSTGYTGTLRTAGGTFNLSYTGLGGTSLFTSGSAALAGVGGTFQFTGKASTANADTFSGLTLDPGQVALTATPGATGGTMTVNLGGITRNAGGIANFSTTGSFTTTSGTSNAVLPYATYGGNDWVKLTGASAPYAIGALGIATNTGESGWAGVDYTNNATANLTAARTANTLKYTATAAIDLKGFTLGVDGVLATTGTLTLQDTVGGGSIGGLSGSQVVLTGPGKSPSPIPSSPPAPRSPRAAAAP